MRQRTEIGAAKRVVVKVGSAVVARADGRLALGRLGAVVEQLAALRKADREVILVSSGAVGLGAERLGFEKPPTTALDRQACAAAGQGVLMAFYDQLFGRLGTGCAQVLLTSADFRHRERYVNLAGTLVRLLQLGTVPVINENDTVSRAEIGDDDERVFGDNDRLGALVAAGTDADLLILLTDVDGVYTSPPARPGARRISCYEMGQEVELGVGSSLGRGGMGAKIASARVAASAGVDVVVASGHDAGGIQRIIDGEDVGTWFPAATDSLNQRRRWIAFATLPEGRIVVNDGARLALVEGKASLLRPGIVTVEGSFEPKAIVSICDTRGEEFARGRCDAGAEELRASLVGTPARGRAVVHRDYVVVFDEEDGWI